MAGVAARINRIRAINRQAARLRDEAADEADDVEKKMVCRERAGGGAWSAAGDG